MYQVNNGYTYKDSKGKVRDCKLTFGEAVIYDETWNESEARQQSGLHCVEV